MKPYISNSTSCGNHLKSKIQVYKLPKKSLPGNFQNKESNKEAIYLTGFFVYTRYLYTVPWTQASPHRGSECRHQSRSSCRCCCGHWNALSSTACFRDRTGGSCFCGNLRSVVLRWVRMKGCSYDRMGLRLAFGIGKFVGFYFVLFFCWKTEIDRLKNLVLLSSNQ